MSQEKLEEIARLLGGISDKLDVVVKNSRTPGSPFPVAGHKIFVPKADMSPAVNAADRMVKIP